MKTSIALGLALLLTITSCKTDKVMDSTLEMSKTTNEMKTGMDQTNVTMTQMASNTDNMYHQIRTKEAQETRDRAFEALDKATVFEDKLTEAAAYHQGFEYQLWNNGNTKEDTKEFREELVETAVDEYFRALQRFMDEAKDPSDISPTKEDNYVMNLMALAVTLHEIHHHQEKLVHTHANVEKISMLSVIKDSLRQQQRINSGEITKAELKDHENALLFWHDEAINMLKYRFNMLMTMTLVKVSDVRKKPSFGWFGAAGLYIKAKHVYFSWDSKYNTLTESRQAKINDFVDEAIKTRDFLKEIGVNVELDSNVKKALKNMKLPKCGNCRGTQNENQAIFDTLMKEALK